MIVYHEYCFKMGLQLRDHKLTLKSHGISFIGIKTAKHDKCCENYGLLERILLKTV